VSGLLGIVARPGGTRREAELAVREVEPGVYEVRIDGGEPLRLELLAEDEGGVAILVGARVVRVGLERGAAGTKAHVGDATVALELLDERKQRVRRGAARER
jgi:hypothetical protein